jgi:ParB family chromosome partitioning protein
MPGHRRKSLGSFLDELDPGRGQDGAQPDVPRTASGDSPPWQQVAPNPLNTRDLASRPEKISELAASLREFGQIEPCTVVDRTLFVAIFPKYEAAVRDYHYVQVSGARRRAAVREAGIAHLDVSVKNHLAASPAMFIAATLAENADREDLDPIEEARQVELLVEAAGSNKAAADQLSRSQPWVTHRLHLLKLVGELRAAVASGEFPVREARELHRATEAEQLAALRRYRALVASRERREEQGDQPVTRPRSTPLGAGLKRLKRDPVRIVESLVAELPDDVFRAVLAEGQRRLDGQ